MTTKVEAVMAIGLLALSALGCNADSSITDGGTTGSSAPSNTGADAGLNADAGESTAGTGAADAGSAGGGGVGGGSAGGTSGGGGAGVTPEWLLPCRRDAAVTSCAPSDGTGTCVEHSKLALDTDAASTCPEEEPCDISSTVAACFDNSFFAKHRVLFDDYREAALVRAAGNCGLWCAAPGQGGEPEPDRAATPGSVQGFATWQPVGGSYFETTYMIGALSVVDLRTDFQWQRAHAGPMTIEEAVDYCDSLDLDDYSDWRLPMRMELLSLVNFSTIDPAINVEVFPDTPSENFWTASPGISTLGEPLQRVINFWDGKVNQDAPTGGSAFVRCARVTPSTAGEHYAVHADDTVTDNYTQLTWVREPIESSWGSSNPCDELELSGHDDWRLPSLPELQSLVDEQSALAGNGVLSPDAFTQQWDGLAFWSATSSRAGTGNAWLMNMQTGTSASERTSSIRRMLCVRFER